MFTGRNMAFGSCPAQRGSGGNVAFGGGEGSGNDGILCAGGHDGEAGFARKTQSPSRANNSSTGI